MHNFSIIEFDAANPGITGLEYWDRIPGFGILVLKSR